ncbi:MAG: ATP-dependent Lon protease [Thermodesulfobacteriota bacterium]|nr:ATP-dependent Lon protease [Thermodesulfobacteriota bacterium]
MIFTRKPDKAREEGDKSNRELSDLRASVEKAGLSASLTAIALKELERMENMDPSAPEYSIGLNYIEYILSLPWQNFTNDNLDLDRAGKIMESRHYGLNKIKERMLEYLSVRTLFSLQAFNVLVVDDEEIARDNLEYILKKEGYEVSTAANGLEALNVLKTRNIDLILTDLKMEKMDGMQLLESAKKISPHAELVMITGFATVSSAVDALKKGAFHYLPKPINLDELRSTVRQLIEKKKHLQMTRSPILCFAGPPGTGKTSVGKAIAEALERKFVRISLAGMRDEADLRGHRRTYVGAMPGRIINEIKRAGSRNPVFMLDEIDKIGQDFRGDPASVLLEILDPEQNSRFTDHYLDAPFDLSGVMFISTANVVEKLPAPLLDRLEVIRFTGYTEKEKEHIAKIHLIPRQLQEHGLTGMKADFTEKAISEVIRNYTREAGLRNLEREIATIFRKIARLSVQSDRKSDKVTIDEALVQKLLGSRKFDHETAERGNRPGVATGLVWTEFGGEIIFIEASMMKGDRQLILTGSMGNVLQESAQTALSFVRSNAAQFGIDPDFFEGRDIHIHIPSGAVSKDGPSAGVTIAVALISLLTGKPARSDIALTGELTLSGRILAVSGIREKILAAQRGGIKVTVFPERNKSDIAVLEPEVKEGVEVVLAEDIPGIVKLVLHGAL